MLDQACSHDWSGAAERWTTSSSPAVSTTPATLAPGSMRDWSTNGSPASACGARNTAPHSLRQNKASIIYKATGNLRAVQILLGHAKIENAVRYLGVDARR